MCFPQAPPVTSVRLWELLVWNPGPWAAGAMPFRYVSNSINIVLFGFKKTVVVLLFPGTITPLCGTFIVMCRPKGFLRRFGLKTVTVFARFGISRHIPTKIPRCTPGAFLCRHATLECCVTTPKKASQKTMESGAQLEIFQRYAAVFQITSTQKFAKIEQN